MTIIEELEIFGKEFDPMKEEHREVLYKIFEFCALMHALNFNKESDEGVIRIFADGIKEVRDRWQI